MTGSGNRTFFSLRQHKLLKVKRMHERFSNLHHLNPPPLKNNTCLRAPSQSPQLSPLRLGGCSPLGSPKESWPAPTSGQTEEQRKHCEILLPTASSPSWILEPCLSLSLSPLSLSHSHWILLEWLVIEQHLEGAAVFFPCVFSGRSRPPIIRLPPH